MKAKIKKIKQTATFEGLQNHKVCAREYQPQVTLEKSCKTLS